MDRAYLPKQEKKEEVENTLSYAAGVFDGEGSIWVSAEPVNIHVSVSNTYKPLCAWFENQFGGAYHLTQGKQSRSRGLKAFYNWRMSGRQAQLFLLLILPYLFVKEERAILALTFPTSSRGVHCTPHKKQERYRVMIKMRELNK